MREGKVLQEANEAHYFDRNGICSCGYVNPCKHTNTVTGTLDSSKDYCLQVDDTHHKRVNVVRKHVYCADCGMLLSDIQQKEEYSSYEEHCFNEFGVCKSCYYVNKCKHKQTQTNYEYYLESCYAIDEVQHTITQALQKREECLACGAVIQEEFVGEVTETQNHDGQDACSMCGWKTPEHIHVWKLTDQQVCSATAIDALRHEIVTQIAGYQYCSVCGHDGGRAIVLPAQTTVPKHASKYLSVL